MYIKTKIYALFVNSAYKDIGLVVLYKENIHKNIYNMKAIAVFQNKLKGSYCTFYQDGDFVNVNVHIKGLTPGKHGFHIHTYGDLRSTDCTKCGGHWNPKGKEQEMKRI